MCNCNCNQCKNLIKSTGVAIANTAPNQVLAVTIPQTTFTNLQDYCLVLCQAIPSGAATLPVVIVNGTISIPAICKKGNTLRADQIKSRCRYSITYGNDPLHIMVNNCVPKTGYAV